MSPCASDAFAWAREKFSSTQDGCSHLSSLSSIVSPFRRFSGVSRQVQTQTNTHHSQGAPFNKQPVQMAPAESDDISLILEQSFVHKRDTQQ